MPSSARETGNIALPVSDGLPPVLFSITANIAPAFRSASSLHSIAALTAGVPQLCAQKITDTGTIGAFAAEGRE
jgi:hypothetical protein